MATIAEFRLSADDSALGSAFDDVPSLTCEMEQVIAANDLGMWMSGADRSTIEAALEADPSVDNYSEVTGDDDRWLYNIEFGDDVTDLFSMVVEEGGTLLTASATNGLWTVRIRFEDREDASRIYDQMKERNVHADLLRLHELSTDTADEIGLTPEQYEALTAAINHGYFEIPRDASMEELADELDISHQALSERLRRAYRTLVTTELDIEMEGDEQFLESD
ncbi:helix-turn-helix domain-containing protein [Halomontanus rarus]|uniref:helix-turn-helix domain-containing protein n=1 Tax=Halomontanus rarus TaxID=3034020 RepID=UPI001A99FDDA